MATTTQEEGVVGVPPRDPQQRFADLFRAEEGVTEEEQEAVTTEEEAVVDQADPDVDEEVTDEDALEASDEEVESDEDVFMTLVVDGTEEDHDENSVRKYAQLGRHFTKKNEDLIQRERAFEQRQHEVLAKEQEYAQVLPQIQQLLSLPLGPEPVRGDYPDDTSYLTAKETWRDGMSRVQAVQMEQQRLMSEQQQRAAQQFEQWASQQKTQLLDKLPAWNDPKVARQEGEEITEYLQSMGISPDEISDLYDHRLWLVARDAMRGSKARRTGRAKAKTVKASAPGPGTDQKEVQARQAHQLREKARSGKDRDIAPLMGQLLIAQSKD